MLFKSLASAKVRLGNTLNKVSLSVSLSSLMAVLNIDLTYGDSVTEIAFANSVSSTSVSIQSH